MWMINLRKRVLKSILYLLKRKYKLYNFIFWDYYLLVSGSGAFTSGIFVPLLETGLWTFGLALIVLSVNCVPLFEKMCVLKTSLVIKYILSVFYFYQDPRYFVRGTCVIAIRFYTEIMLGKRSEIVNICNELTPLITVYGLSARLYLQNGGSYYLDITFQMQYYIKMTDGFINNFKEGALYV